MKGIESYRRHVLYNKGRDKIIDELDAATLMKTVR
jgi:hypothetical protein